MALHHGRQQRPAGGVQRGHRLVQQPDRPGGGDEPGKSQTTALARRKPADLQVEQRGQGQLVDGPGDAFIVAAQPAGLEGEFLQRGAPAFKAIGVAEQMTAGYISADYRDAITFAILIGVLLVRPQGLFGSIKVEKI
jgi:hypothetical protein